LNSSERILTRHSARLPSIILQQAVVYKSTVVPTAAIRPGDAVAKVLQPNLKEDVEQTRQQQNRQLCGTPVMLEVEQGEVIVRAGEVITQQEFLLLDYFSLSRREINWLGLTQLEVL